MVTPSYGDPWDEQQVLAARIAGALACGAAVDVLVPGDSTSRGWDATCRVLRFPGTRFDPRRRRAWRLALLGAEYDDEEYACTCHHRGAGRRALPVALEEQLLLAEGGDALALYEFLAAEAYDLVVFIGLASPVAHFGAAALKAAQRVVVVPGRVDSAILEFGVFDELFDRAERIVVSSEAERERLMARLGSSAAQRIENIGFLTQINPIARDDEPYEFEDRPWLVLALDWNAVRDPAVYGRWGERLGQEVHRDVQIRLVGPGAEHIPYGLRLTSRPVDAWRWMSRSLAVVDPLPHRLLGREVLEAMAFGVPVIVNADGYATREHAELSNGGLWYRTDEEFYAVARALLNPGIRDVLGAQGRRYFEEGFTDTEAYVKRVNNVWDS